jgi:predicted transcriptional regulator of viral defense system
MTYRTLRVLIFGYTPRNIDAFMVIITTIDNGLVNCMMTTNGCN